MNVEIGAEAAQFPEKEYINGIPFAVQITIKIYLKNEHSYAWMKNYEKAVGKISLWIRKTKKSAEQHYICSFKKLLADEIF